MPTTPPATSTRWLQRPWVRFLLTTACVVILLCAGGAWWLHSHNFGDEVRREGGRFRFVKLDSSAVDFFRFLSGREPRIYHYIDFEGSDVDDEWLHAHRDRIARLSILVLFLRETRVTGDGLSALRGMQNVTFLDLTGTPLADADIAHLVALPNVVQLYIGRTGISDSALAGLSQMPNLVHVSIDSTQATQQGIVGLATCPKVEALTLLDADDVSVQQVAQLSGLTSLMLSGEDVTAASLATLKQLQGLQSLMLYGTDFSEDEIRELQESLPGCFVEQRGIETLNAMREAAWIDRGD